MLRDYASEIYTHFIDSVNRSGAAYSVQCGDDLVAVCGPGIAPVPLWPDKESADFFIARHWPDLRRYRYTRRQLLMRLPMFGVSQIPVGIGRKPFASAVVVPAMTLFDDLIAEDGPEPGPTAGRPT